MDSQRYKLPEFSAKEFFSKLYGTSQHPNGNDDSQFTTHCPLPGHGVQPTKGKLWVKEYATAITVGCTKHYPQGIKLWDYLHDQYGVPGFDAWGTSDFDETIEFVCKVLGVEPEARDNTKLDITIEVKKLYKRIQKDLKPVTFARDNEHFIEGKYRSHGPTFLLQEMNIGMLTPATLSKLKQDFNLSVWNNAGLNFSKNKTELWVDWLTSGVVMMRHNTYGSVVSLAVRRYEIQDRMGKYIKSSSNNILLNDRDYLYNYHRAKRSDSPVVYITEGEFDAVGLYLSGVEKVIATGHSSPTDGQIKTLQELDCQIVMIVDNDDAGFQGAVNLAKKDSNVRFIWLTEEAGKVDGDTFSQQYGEQTNEALQDLNVWSANAVLMTAAPHSSINPDLWQDRDGQLDRFVKIIAKSPGIDERNDIAIAAGKSLRSFDEVSSMITNLRLVSLKDMLSAPNTTITISTTS